MRPLLYNLYIEICVGTFTEDTRSQIFVSAGLAILLVDIIPETDTSTLPAAPGVPMRSPIVVLS